MALGCELVGLNYWWATGLIVAIIAIVSAVKWAKWVNDKVERPAFRSLKVLVEVFGFAVVIATAFQIMDDLADRRAEQHARTADAVERNRNRLLSPAVGNTGKGDAITTLVEMGTSLDGVDLSCQDIGKWDENAKRCLRQVIFSDVKLVGQAPSRSHWQQLKIDAIWQLDISDASFRNASIEDFALLDVTAPRASFASAKIVRSIIDGELAGASFADCSLRESYISPTGQPPTIAECDVSGALLPWLGDIREDELKLFAWADAPPLNTTVKDRRILGYGPIPMTSHSDETLAKILFCDPPRKANGSIIPLSEREFELGGECHRMTVLEAKAAFPNAYTQDQGFWFQITSPRIKSQ